MQAEENLNSAAGNTQTASSCPRAQQGEAARANLDCAPSHSGFHCGAQPHAPKVTACEPLCTSPPEGSLAFDGGSAPASPPCPENDAAARNGLRTRGKGARRHRVCKYFLAGGCFHGDRCHFAHPPHADLPPLGGDVSVDTRRTERTILIPRCAEQRGPYVGAGGLASDGGRSGRPFQAKGRKYRPAVARPSLGVQPLSLEGLTTDAVAKLRGTEIAQLGKRFPGDQLIVQESDDGKVTFYRFTVNPTDPDWPFDIINLEVMVSFPENYPLEVFQVTIPEDQDLPSIMGRHVEKFSQDWLQAKHATVQLLGQPELLFRPFLRWLDRNMERLFTEGARLLKRELAAERAGIQFIPFRDLSGTKSTSPPHSPLLATQDSGQSTTDVSEEEIKKKPSQEDCELHGEEESAPCEYDDCEEEIDLGGARDGDSTPATMRKGTEVKLLGLSMGEDAGILIAQSLALLLQCTRCKAKEEVRVSAEGASSAECSKCHAQLSAKAHFSAAHHNDPVLGKLNLQFCHAVELLLQTSQLALTCLHCSLKHPLVGLCYGVKREFNCRYCHRRLSVLIEGVRLYSFEPALEATANSVILKPKNYNKGAVIQPGKPLPGNGTCKHYKKSFRWLRFPCCGRAYPCDLCHNEDQSHEMELATRMICGFCAREQPYSNGKACLGCGSFMTNSNFTPHWEGGQGCRNQIRMSRKDKQKYSNSNKTVSRKATALQGKQ